MGLCSSLSLGAASGSPEQFQAPGPSVATAGARVPRANHSSSPCNSLGLGQPEGEQKLHLSPSLQGWPGGRKGELSLLGGQGLAAPALIVLSGEEPASLQASAGGFLVPSPCWLCPLALISPRKKEAGCSGSCLVAWEKRHQARHQGRGVAVGVRLHPCAPSPAQRGVCAAAQHLGRSAGVVVASPRAPGTSVPPSVSSGGEDIGAAAA